MNIAKSGSPTRSICSSANAPWSGPHSAKGICFIRHLAIVTLLLVVCLLRCCFTRRQRLVLLQGRRQHPSEKIVLSDLIGFSHAQPSLKSESQGDRHRRSRRARAKASPVH